MSKPINTARDLKCENVMITGDINCSKTDWKAMTTEDADEQLIFVSLIDNSFEQILSPEKCKSLKVLLINNPSLVINTFRK